MMGADLAKHAYVDWQIICYYIIGTKIKNKKVTEGRNKKHLNNKISNLGGLPDGAWLYYRDVNQKQKVIKGWN